MNEIPTAQPKFDEVLSRFPELDRARNLFIQLLNDSSTLSQLGYTKNQVDFAFPTLQLLEKEGKILYDYAQNPYLNFESLSNYEEALYLYCLPSKQGFNLSAYKNNVVWDKLSPEEKILAIINMGKNAFILFDDFDTQVAHIGLFDKKEKTNDLDYLIQELYTLYSTSMKRESALANFTRTIGLIGTYKAAWVDEETKLEFVAKINMVRSKKSNPDYVAYRRLKTISDSIGSFIPFGKKANTSQQKVMKIVSGQKERSMTGQLNWAESKI